MITRCDPRGETPGALWLEQALALEQTLQVFTIEGAKALRLQTGTGSLKVANSADMIVPGHNLFEIAPDAIAHTNVDMTMFAGKIVHQSGAFC